MNEQVAKWLAGLPTVDGYHVPDSRRATMRGWPDWVLIGENGILFRELKGSDDELSRDQRRVGRLLTLNGMNWGVWWPRDMRPDGRAFKEITAIALPFRRAMLCPATNGKNRIVSPHYPRNSERRHCPPMMPRCRRRIRR